VLGLGVLTAVATGGMTFTGGKLYGQPNPDADDLAIRDNIRKRYRRPVEETIAELGEGRGIYGPGYKERRQQRIKDNYGIDVP
jgi:hypothetical protein